MNKTYILGVALLMLVILPGGSYFYLKMGVGERKKILAELQDLGTVPAFFSKTAEDRPFLLDSLADKIGIWQLALPPSDTAARSALMKLYEQFKERDDVRILTLFPADTSLQMRPIQQEWLGKRHSRWVFAQADSTSTALLQKTFDPAWGGNSLVFLTNKNGRICNRYELKNRDELHALFKHVVILLPTVANKESSE